MLEFRAHCKPENVTDVTSAISDSSVSATLVHSLNFFCGFYSLLKTFQRESRIFTKEIEDFVFSTVHSPKQFD